MSMDMPTLGKPSRTGTSKTLLITLLFLVAAGGAGYFWYRGQKPAAEPPPVPATDEPAAPEATPAPPPAEARAHAVVSPVDDALKQAGLRYLSATIDGPLERAVVHKVGRATGLRLTQVMVRALVWWVDVPNGLRKGDVVEVLFEEPPGATEPAIAAIRFKSGKMNRTFRAYRYKPVDARFGNFFEADGQALELRLTDGPLDQYEQVTSLLRDGRGHAGVDFKTPVGTPAKSPFEGTVTRVNWNIKSNGNCVAVQESGGARRTALFLHLSEISDGIRVGARVARGQVVARTGNTGHSFAPHLHYQLTTSSGAVLDPYDSHNTYRVSLPEKDKAAFTAEVNRRDQLLDLAGARAAR